jgi:hypothetical protein
MYVSVLGTENKAFLSPSFDFPSGNLEFAILGRHLGLTIKI